MGKLHYPILDLALLILNFANIKLENNILGNFFNLSQYKEKMQKIK